MGNIMINWNSGSGFLNYGSNSYGFAYADFGQDVLTNGDKMKFMHPVVSVNYVLGRIKNVHNIQFDTKNLFDNLYIPLLSKNSNEIIDRNEGFKSSSINITWNAPPKPAEGLDGDYQFLVPNFWEDKHGLWDANKKAFKMPDSKKLSGHLEFYTGTSSIIYLIGIPETGGHDIINGYQWPHTDIVGGHHHFVIDFKDLEILSHPWIRFAFSAYYGTSLVQTRTMDVNIWQTQKELTFPTQFPIIDNLPDMSIGDFLKNLMQMTGIFAYQKGPRDIGFISVADFLQKKNDGSHVDWTNKLMNESPTFNEPAEIGFKLSNFAQNNICSWAKDDTVRDEFSGVIQTNNANIALERKAVELKFAGSLDYGAYSSAKVAKMELYTPEYKSSLKPRILRGVNINGKLGLVFQDLDFPSLIGKYYKEYQEVVRDPRVVKVKCLLSDFDISILDMTKPIYFEQFGHFYAPIKIQTKSGGICDCELLEI